MAPDPSRATKGRQRRDSAIGPVPLTKGASRGTNAGQKAPWSAYTRSWNRTNSSTAAESAGTSIRGPMLPHYAGPQPLRQRETAERLTTGSESSDGDVHGTPRPLRP